jgi:multiple antibiotic resistance protein
MAIPAAFSAHASADVAVTPWAIPILAGPGTISTAMRFVGPHAHSDHALVVALVSAVFAATCGLTRVFLLPARRPVALPGWPAIKVNTHLMGLLLIVMAAQRVIQGVGGGRDEYRSGHVQ